MRRGLHLLFGIRHDKGVTKDYVFGEKAVASLAFSFFFTCFVELYPKAGPAGRAAVAGHGEKHP